MKKFLFLFLCSMLISIPTFASNAEEKAFVIEQTIEFSDTRDTLVIYYVKEAGVYKVYSEADLTKQNPQRLGVVTGSNFKKVSSYKGKCYVTCTTIKEVIDLAYSLYQKYGKYIPELYE